MLNYDFSSWFWGCWLEQLDVTWTRCGHGSYTCSFFACFYGTLSQGDSFILQIKLHWMHEKCHSMKNLFSILNLWFSLQLNCTDKWGHKNFRSHSIFCLKTRGKLWFLCMIYDTYLTISQCQCCTCNTPGSLWCFYHIYVTIYQGFRVVMQVYV